jgi:hypothetical protein
VKTQQEEGRSSTKVVKLRREPDADQRRKPQNLPAEQAVLGTILAHQQAALDELAGLLAEHFGEPLYAALYDVMRALIGRGMKASPVTLKPFIDTWEPIDGQTTVYQHLGRLAAEAAAVRDLPNLVSVIVDDWMRRQLIVVGEDAVHAAYNPRPDFSPEEILEEVRGRLGSALEASRTHAQDGELTFACDATIEKLATPLIKGMVSAATVAALYAPSGAGKTFVALEMAFCIGLAKPFMGRPTEQGAVLIVPLEGRSNLPKRLVAARSRHGDPGKAIACMKASGTLGNDAASEAYVGRLITAGKQLAKTAGRPLRLVIIDTLARALGGENENDAAVMDKALCHAQRIVAETGATVLLIHHPGKDLARGMRGNYALQGGCDDILRIDREEGSNTRELYQYKSRDGKEGPIGAFTLETVDLGSDMDGEPLTSCTLKAVAAVSSAREPQRPPSTTAAGKALVELEHLLIEEQATPSHGHPRIPDGTMLVKRSAWQAACIAKRLSNGKPDNEERVFRRADSHLSGRGLIGTFGDVVWLIRADKSRLSGVGGCSESPDTDGQG